MPNQEIYSYLFFCPKTREKTSKNLELPKINHEKTQLKKKESKLEEKKVSFCGKINPSLEIFMLKIALKKSGKKTENCISIFGEGTARQELGEYRAPHMHTMHIGNKERREDFVLRLGLPERVPEIVLTTGCQMHAKYRKP